MAEDMRKAMEVYNTMCDMLDHKGWHYEKVEEKLMVKSGVKGDDLPIDFVMSVNAKNEVVSFISFFPFDIPENKRVDLAIAVCVANYGMIDGSFDYDITDGSILFRLTSSYRDSQLGEELFEYMLMVGVSTVDEYNDKFFMISKDMLSLEKFLAEETN